MSSKNSQTAKSGFKAEEIFRTSEIIKQSLEEFFKKQINRMVKIIGKKYDTIIYFEDGTSCNVQNKKIEQIGGRGDSFDRRPLETTFINEDLKTGLKELLISRRNCLTKEEKILFQEICENNSEDIGQYLKKTFCGPTGDQNDYWAIMKTNSSFDNIQLFMVSTQTIYTFIQTNISIKVCRTCLHLSPHIYLQRKGGDKTDKSPNDIQAKFKLTQEVLNLCEQILGSN